jgi:hypothetical protein
MVEIRKSYRANSRKVVNLNNVTQIIDKDLKFIDFSSDENPFVGWDSNADSVEVIATIGV